MSWVNVFHGGSGSEIKREMPSDTAVNVPEVDDKDRRAFISSVLIGVGFGILAMVYSLYLWRYKQAWEHHVRVENIWYAPGDIWSIVTAGRFVWHGALGQVYMATNGAYALPLSFILTAPVSAIVDHYSLAESIFPLPRPSAWLVVGPYSLLFGIFILDAVRRLAWDLGARKGLWRFQFLSVLVVLVPVFQWGHFEDGIALTFCLHAVRYCLKRQYVHAGLLLSLAVCSKQWALMLIPLLFFIAPRGDRIKASLASLALPLVFVALLVSADPHDAINALFSPINLTPKQAPGHLSFYATWLGRKTSRASRTAGLLASPILAWVFRRSTNAPSLIAAASVLVLIRPFSEAINYSYYWAPPLVLSALVGVAAHREFRWRDWIWQISAIAWTLPVGNRESTTEWWLVETFFLVLVYLRVAWNCGFSIRKVLGPVVAKRRDFQSEEVSTIRDSQIADQGQPA